MRLTAKLPQTFGRNPMQVKCFIGRRAHFTSAVLSRAVGFSSTHAAGELSLLVAELNFA